MHAPKETEDVAPATQLAEAGDVRDLDHSAAMLRAESDHLEATLNALVTRLSSVPGLKLTVSARPGILRRLIGDLPYVNDLRRRTSPIHRMVAQIGDCSYWLRASHGSLKCGRETTTGEHGQVNEELPFAPWANALFDDIDAQNLVNHESMVALRRLVEQNRVQ